MRGTVIKVTLNGEAHNNFQQLYPLLENDKLTINCRVPCFPVAVVKKERPYQHGDIGTEVHIIARPQIDVIGLVKDAVEKINTLYPGSTSMVVTR